MKLKLPEPTKFNVREISEALPQYAYLGAMSEPEETILHKQTIPGQQYPKVTTILKFRASSKENQRAGIFTEIETKLSPDELAKTLAILPASLEQVRLQLQNALGLPEIASIQRERFVAQFYQEQESRIRDNPDSPIGVIKFREPLTVDVRSLLEPVKAVFPNALYRGAISDDNGRSEAINDEKSLKRLLSFGSKTDDGFQTLESSLSPRSLSTLLLGLPPEIGGAIRNAAMLPEPTRGDIEQFEALKRQQQTMAALLRKYDSLPPLFPNATGMLDNSGVAPTCLNKEEALFVPQDNDRTGYRTVRSYEEPHVIYTEGMLPCVCVCMVSNDDNPTVARLLHADANTRMDLIKRMASEFPNGAEIYVHGGDINQASIESQVRILQTVDEITRQDHKFKVAAVDVGRKPHSTSFGYDTRTRTVIGNPVVSEIVSSHLDKFKRGRPDATSIRPGSEDLSRTGWTRNLGNQGE